jgi:chorismate-pyruvate lyase
MADIVDPARLLELLRGFSPLRRVLLATAGTLQGALSAYFGAPVSVDVVAQDSDRDVMHRTVDLVCKDRRLVVCRAATEIDVVDPRIREMIVERNLGLGQIATLLGVRTSFELDEVGQETGSFWRMYRLWGEGFRFRITETFPAELYPDLGGLP